MSKHDKDAISEATLLFEESLRSLGDASRALLRAAQALGGTEPSPSPAEPTEPPREPRAAAEGEPSMVLVAADGWAEELTIDEGDEKLLRHGDLAFIASKSNGIPVVAVANPFKGSGPIKATGLRITVDGMTHLDRAELALAAGTAQFYWDREGSQRRAWGIAGPQAQTAALLKLNKWSIDLGGFTIDEGIEYWGPRDANGPGGAMVYPNLGWWADYPTGRRMLWRLVAGLANRMQIFRLDRDAFDRGKIVFDQPAQGFRGYGGCGVDYLEGYPASGGRWKSLDHAHLGRAGHGASRLADWGLLPAKFVEAALAADVATTWSVQTDGRSQNKLRWSAKDLQKKWPQGIGCRYFGRPFAHALIVAVNHARRGGDIAPVVSMVDAACHIATRQGYVYLHHEIDPLTQTPNSAYTKKLVAQGMPAGSYGPLQVCFEETLVLYALVLASEVYSSAALQALLPLVQAQLGAYPPYLKFPDKPRKNHGSAPWGHALQPYCELGSFNLPDLAASTHPTDSPCSAACPELWR
jgi:hypothetical protein